MRGLRSDGNAEREILDWPGKVIAALVAAPKQQDLLQLDPAPDQGGVVAIRGEQNVLVTHGAGHANRHRLLAKRCGIGSEPAGTLQRHSFQVEGAHQHHCPVKPDELPGIGGEGREPSMDRTIRREIVAVAHLESRDHREALICVPTFGHVTPPRRTPDWWALLDGTHGKAGHEPSCEEIIDNRDWDACDISLV